jgi:phenylacetate-CoA ligase
VLEYQVRQTPGGADIVVRTSAKLDTESLRRELLQSLAALGLAQPQVSVADLEAIERVESTGKLRRFVPLARERR